MKPDKKTIEIIHDLALCNTVIENCYKNLLHKLKDRKPLNYTEKLIFKNMNTQIEKSKKISKEFFDRLNKEFFDRLNKEFFDRLNKE